MRALRVAVLVAGVAGVAVVAPPAVAQVSIGAAGLYASINGSDFDGTDAGFGLDAQVRFPLGTGFSLGIGGQWTTHGIQGTSDNLGVLGVFGEPRYVFTTTSETLKPYLAARGGYLHESFSGGGIDASASGYFVGGGGGLVISVGPTVSVDLAVLWTTVSFGDATVNGSKVSNSNTSGSALAIRGGVLIGLGK